MSRGRRVAWAEPRRFLLGVAGDPVSHSLSPMIQNAALRHLAVPYHYRAFLCPDGKALRRLIQQAPEQGLKGLNITTPLKESAARILVRHGAADDEVQWSGSANTLLLGDHVTGGSTDGRGGVAWLRELGTSRSDRILLLGGGSTAKNLVWHLLTLKFRHVGVVTRRPRTVRPLMARSGLPGADGVAIMKREELDHGQRWRVVVSTLPPDAVDGELIRVLSEALGPEPRVIDLNYGRGRAKLALWARKRGFASWDGRGFLLHQGALSFRMFTGRRAPLDVMRRAIGLR